MKWIMIIVVFPGNIMPGTERHIPLNSHDECMEALAGVIIPPDQGGLKYCTTADTATWYYPSENPANRKPQQ